MSLVSTIARTFTRSLKLVSRPSEPDHQRNQYVKLRHTNVTNLQDPRFTKAQWDKLMAKVANDKLVGN